MTTIEEPVWPDDVPESGVLERDSEGAVLFDEAKLEQQQEKARSLLAVALVLLIAGMLSW